MHRQRILYHREQQGALQSVMPDGVWSGSDGRRRLKVHEEVLCGVVTSVRKD